MKKIMSFILLVCMFIPCSILFTACKVEKDPPAVNPVGLYQVSEVVIVKGAGSEEITRAQYNDLKATDIESLEPVDAMILSQKLMQLSMYFEFNIKINNGGTWEQIVLDDEWIGESPADLSLTWTIEDSDLILNTSSASEEININYNATYTNDGFYYTQGLLNNSGEIDIYYEKVEA